MRIVAFLSKAIDLLMTLLRRLDKREYRNKIKRHNNKMEELEENYDKSPLKTSEDFFKDEE